jgi:hypothetical protein
VVDPFSGSGTIPLEATLLGRNVFASDSSAYAATLTRAKLNPASSLETAFKTVDEIAYVSEPHGAVDLRTVPAWVRAFFHPQTLKSVLRFWYAAMASDQYFIMACLLGILHHQRPGFLSYPASHLVPYLRSNKFPEHLYPELYSYRPFRPRLLAKIERALARCSPRPIVASDFVHAPLRMVDFPSGFDALITSPPYMNALDYERDNRLRLWFLKPDTNCSDREPGCRSISDFVNLVRTLADLVEARLANRGHCVLVVGESVSRGSASLRHPARIALDIMRERASSLTLLHEIRDSIPDIRRARRENAAVKSESVLVFKKK